MTEFHATSRIFSKQTNQEQPFRLDWTNNLPSLIHLPFLVIRHRSRLSSSDDVVDNDDGNDDDDGGDDTNTMYAFMWWTWSFYNVSYVNKRNGLTHTHAHTHSQTIYIVCRKERNYSFFSNDRQRFKIHILTQTQTHGFQHDEYN